MNGELKDFNDIVTWATWQLMERLTRGEPLRSAVYGVLMGAVNALEDIKKKQAKP